MRLRRDIIKWVNKVKKRTGLKKDVPKRIALIGAFGGDELTTTGRIIRTRILYDELAIRYGKENIIKISTEVNSAVRLLIRCILGVIRSETIMLFVSESGMNLLFPMMGFFAKFTDKKVYNSIIGGYIPTVIGKYPRSARAMRSFEVNWVQMPSMVQMLADADVHNAEFLPNAKPYQITAEQDIYSPEQHDLIQVCTFSRVIKDKGIEEAIEAVKHVNEKGVAVELHIYGEIYIGYKDTFESIMKEVPHYIKYCGIVDYHNNLNVLKQYYLLLFPSIYKAEGFPGTLTDAFFSGTPVIATNWNYNRELIEEGKTGFLYEPQDLHRLEELLVYAIKNPELIQQMRLNCIHEAKKYTYDTMMEQIFYRV